MEGADRLAPRLEILVDCDAEVATVPVALNVVLVELLVEAQQSARSLTSEVVRRSARVFLEVLGVQLLRIRRPAYGVRRYGSIDIGMSSDVVYSHTGRKSHKQLQFILEDLRP